MSSKENPKTLGFIPLHDKIQSRRSKLAVGLLAMSFSCSLPPCPPAPWIRILIKKVARKGNDNDNARNLYLPLELVDECLSYVFEPTDLKASALVCRLWSTAAQRALFRVISVGATHRLEETLRTSPHLAKHVRELALHRNCREPDDIQALEHTWNPPFTRLESVSIRDLTMKPRSAVDSQRLLSLSTVRRVCLEVNFVDTAAFLPIWDNCSPNIRQLQLHCVRPCSDGPLEPTQCPSSAPVELESLKVDGASFIQEWLQHHFCPLDFSHLRVLSVLSVGATAALCGPRMRLAYKSLQALEFERDPQNIDPLDLSFFPNLISLRICVHSIQAVTKDLETIKASSRIRAIEFMFYFPDNPGVCAKVHSAIAKLPMQHPLTVGLELDNKAFACFSESSRSARERGPVSKSSENRFIRIDPNPGWFERCINEPEELGWANSSG
ncbi:hypothetical protein K438DRAFT_786902 [Mycena galopus ATCC 62051]|nr:hypothetical protein K438DRAFT_786902 [Mycena galopus ATCC 62051]